MGACDKIWGTESGRWLKDQEWPGFTQEAMLPIHQLSNRFLLDMRQTMQDQE